MNKRMFLFLLGFCLIAISLMGVTSASTKNLFGVATYNDYAGAGSIENMRGQVITPDGNYLITSSYNDDYISIMNITNKSAITLLSSYTDNSGGYSINGIRSLAVTPDGNYLITSSEINDYVSIMNITNKSATPVGIFSYTDGVGVWSIDGVNFVGVTPDGNHLITTGLNDDYISIMNIENKSKITNSTNASTYYNTTGAFSIDSIWVAAVTPDGNYLITSSGADATVSIINITNKTGVGLVANRLSSYTDNSGGYSIENIYHLAVTPDGNYLITSSVTDNQTSIMNITNKSVITPISTYNDYDGNYSIESIRTLAITPDGNYLITGSNPDDYISIMNITNRSVISPLNTYFDNDGDYSVDGVASYFAVTPDGNYLVASSSIDNQTSIFNISNTEAGVDTTPPTYSGQGVNTTIASATAKFYALWNDNSALHPNGAYVFSTNNTGTWVNDSSVFFTTTPNWANVTKVLNNTVGTVVGYRWYANDTLGNANFTATIHTLTITSTDTCTCAGLNTNWAIAMSDYCNITSACNLGTGNLSFTATGWCNISNTINTKSGFNLANNQNVYLWKSGGIILIG